MKNKSFITLCLCSVLMFSCFNNLQAQCINQPGYRYDRLKINTRFPKFSQNFTSNCTGNLSQLTIDLTINSSTSDYYGVNISLYKGESPSDPNSVLLYKVENYALQFSSQVVLNISNNVLLEEGKKYHFIVTNSQTNQNLPSGIFFGYSYNQSGFSSNNSNRPSGGGGFAYYVRNDSEFKDGPYLDWYYPYENVKIGTQGLFEKGIDIRYTATVIPSVIKTSIYETYSLCKGNALQILHYDSTNSTYKISDNGGVFNLTTHGDTAIIKGLNYGTASFIYTKKGEPTKQYICQVAVTNHTAPSITASKNILTSVNDTATLRAEGSTNMAMRFDGTKYLTIPNNNGLQFSNGFTVEAWIRSDDVKVRQRLFFKGLDGIGCGVYIENGKILFENNNTGYLAFSTYSTYRYTEWTHIAVTYDGTNVIFYVNGRKEWVSPYNSSILNNQHDILIGVYAGINAQQERYKYDFFKGQMDEFRLWNVCRTEDEIQTNYQKSVLGYSKGLVAYYNFDQVVNYNLIQDVSMNYNHANVYNSQINVSTGNPLVGTFLDIQKYTYVWSNNATRPHITIINPDTYFYKRTDLLTGCTAESQIITITQPNK